MNLNFSTYFILTYHSMSKKMGAVGRSSQSPQRAIGRGVSPAGLDYLRNHARHVAIVTGPATQESQDRERRRRNDDWSEMDTQYRGTGETMTVLDIKDSARGRIPVLVLWPKARSGFKPRVTGHW
jgi:hypothetical protein